MVRLQRLHAPLRLLRGFVRSKSALFCFSEDVYLWKCLTCGSSFVESKISFNLRLWNFSTKFVWSKTLGTLVTQPCPQTESTSLLFQLSLTCAVRAASDSFVDNAAVEKKEAVSALSKLVAKCSRVGGKERCGNLGRKGGVCVLRATACNVSLDPQVCESSVHVLNA